MPMRTYKFEYQLYYTGTKTAEMQVHTERAFTAEDARTQARTNFEECSIYSLNHVVPSLIRIWTEEGTDQ